MIDIVGLGPGDLDRVAAGNRSMMEDPGRTVVVRTLEHPAAAQLAELRPVQACDDIYRSAATFDDVYDAIAERVVELALGGDVVYAVPGSPTVGEFAVARIRRQAAKNGLAVSVHPAESFLDAVTEAVGIDPLRDGLKLLNAHELPNPLVFDVPTIIGHLDMPALLGDVAAELDRLLDEDRRVCLLRDLGSADARVVWALPTELDAAMAGLRTSIFVPAAPSGILGAVEVMRRLREACPWDRAQTHRSLVRYLLEESHELADAIAALPPPGSAEEGGAYADVEDELGDVLLQVLFHAVIAEERQAFDISDVAEQLRRKLVRRHPHVFGDVDAEDAEAVRTNWDVIKTAEKAGRPRPSSALAEVPASLAGLERAAELGRRAAALGFDWPEVAPVFDKVLKELEELRLVVDDPEAAEAETGDLLLAVVSLARHLDVEPEVAIRSASHRFESRFRAMEAAGPMEGLTPEELDQRWRAVKGRERGRTGEEEREAGQS